MGNAMLAQQPRTNRQQATGRRIELLLVDDHRAVLDALATALGREPDMAILGTAGSIAELSRYLNRRPDVALVDYSLPDGTGADACRLIKARWPSTRIVILSATDAEPDVMAAIRAGADGYMTKGQRLSVLVSVLRDAYAGRQLLGADVLGRIARGLHALPSEPVLTSPLTPRELGVLRALADGHSTHVIAAELGIAEGTVLRHIEAIRRKFGVGTRLEAVTKAIQHDIVQPPVI
jgi:DNA-binding NarL/FixJ family response regulator